MTFGRSLPATRRRVVAALSALALGAGTLVSAPGTAAQAAPSRAPAALAATPATFAAAPPAALAAPAGAPAALTAANAPAALAAAKADVPCPKPDVKPPAGRPARPKPPADDPVLRAVGGDALATDGLVVPARVKKPPALTATTWLVADLDTGEVLGG